MNLSFPKIRRMCRPKGQFPVKRRHSGRLIPPARGAVKASANLAATAASRRKAERPAGKAAPLVKAQAAGPGVKDAAAPRVAKVARRKA